MAEHLAQLRSGPAHQCELQLGFLAGARTTLVVLRALRPRGMSEQNFVAVEVWALNQDDAQPQAPNTSVHAALAIARWPPLPPGAALIALAVRR